MNVEGAHHLEIRGARASYGLVVESGGPKAIFDSPKKGRTDEFVSKILRQWRMAHARSSISRRRELLQADLRALAKHQSGDGHRRNRTGCKSHPRKHVHKEPRMPRDFSKNRFPVGSAVDDRRPASHDMDIGKCRHDTECKPKVVAQRPQIDGKLSIAFSIGRRPPASDDECAVLDLLEREFFLRGVDQMGYEGSCRFGYAGLNGMSLDGKRDTQHCGNPAGLGTGTVDNSPGRDSAGRRVRDESPVDSVQPHDLGESHGADAEAHGSGGKTVSRLQRVGAAFVRTERSSDDVLGNIRGQRTNVLATDEFGVDTVLPFDPDLSPDVPHLRFRMCDKQSALGSDTKINVKFAADPGPQLGRFDQKRYDGGKRMGPVLALQEEHIVRNLDVETTGIGARSLGVEIKAIDNQDFDVLLGKKIRCCRTGETTADDQYIGFHSPALRRGSPLPQILA